MNESLDILNEEEPLSVHSVLQIFNEEELECLTPRTIQAIHRSEHNYYVKQQVIPCIFSILAEKV